jgi:hypothetical protein
MLVQVQSVLVQLFFCCSVSSVVWLPDHDMRVVHPKRFKPVLNLCHCGLSI